MIKTLIAQSLRKFNYQISKLSTIPNAQPSTIVPTESWTVSADDRLLDLSLQAIQVARAIDHADIVAKMKEYPHWPNIWPGEHYKLLSGLVSVLKPKVVIEIGTATGYSALAMKKFLPSNGVIYTFDIFRWKETPNCILAEADFQDKRLIQEIADISEPSIFNKYRDILTKADFIFIDAAKDGVQEQKFINNFNTLKFETNPIFMFDDIRVINMIDIWNNLKKPKLDLTSFGHWSGTGLVNWC